MSTKEVKKVFFLESYNPSVKYNGEIVSLNPAVSYYLYKKNIKYHILEDYYSEKDLRSSEEEYFFKQLEWFDCFDVFIKENISFCNKYNIPMAKASYLRLKYFSDMVIIYSYILSRFFQGNRSIEHVAYVHPPFVESDRCSVFNFRYKSVKIFCDLLQLFSKKYNVQYTDYLIDGERDASKKKLLNNLENNLFLKSQIKKMINFFKYEKFKKIIPSNSHLKDLNIFFINAGSLDIDYPMKMFIRHNARIYSRERGVVLQEDILSRKPIDIPSLDNAFLIKLREECEFCAGNLEKDTKVISWVNNICTLDVSSVILPFLKYFISKECFHVLQDAAKMYNFYKRNKIDYIFARGNTDIDSLGPLVAAKYMNGARSVCVEHSCFAFDMEVFGVFETETYNYTITRDSISQDYFEYSIKNRYKSDCKVIESPYYLRSIRKKNSGLKKKKKKEQIVYVERKFADIVRSFNNMVYPLTWYFEFQKQIINYFGQETKYDFMYKHAQGTEWAEHSILDYIKDSGFENITILRENFLKTLKYADRVIVDYPSGAFFEAAISGKPVLCICADYFKILKQAKAVFGKSLQQFASTDDAISIIKEFLCCEPQDYTVNIPLSKNDFLDAFEELHSMSEHGTSVKNN